MKQINLGDLKVPVLDYASQGNGVLGIRDSGKSYTSTYIAEQLMKANIPFIAFDPIGVWRWLRVGKDGKPGFPVVVAGGKSGDLPLTPQSAPDIVRSAMRENVNLVIDLYDIHLSKADWSRIVESAIHVLLYENEDYGLRHVFLEEAAEFAPQMIRDNHAKVYAEVEKLARMGGNSRLGYTLINQRAEEVNKAVLELCDCLILHRQKGRNSLNALSKWLDAGDVTDYKIIAKSLPKLGQGECWVWAAGSDTPVRTHVPEKVTVHPDRRALHQQESVRVTKMDVSAFVKKMSESLEKHLVEVKANDPATLQKRINELERQLAQRSTVAAPVVETKIVQVPVFQGREVETLTESMRSLNSSAEEIVAALNQAQAKIKLASNGHSHTPTPRPTPVQPTRKTTPALALSPSNNESSIKLPKGELAIMKAIAQYPDGVSREQLTQLTGYKRSSRDAYIRRLQAKGCITNDLGPTQTGIDALGDGYEPLPTGDELIEYWMQRLPEGERAYFSVAVVDALGHWINKQEADNKTNNKYQRSSRDAYLRRLKARNLIEDDNDGAYRAHPDLYK